jgi:hypothetical protein
MMRAIITLSSDVMQPVAEAPSEPGIDNWNMLVGWLLRVPETRL